VTNSGCCSIIVRWTGRVIAQTLVNTIRDYRFAWRDRVFRIGMSIGLVPSPPPRRRHPTAYPSRYCLLYRKQLGRDRVHIYQQRAANPPDTTVGFCMLPSCVRPSNRDAFGFTINRSSRWPRVAPRRHGTNCYSAWWPTNGEILLPEAFLPLAERHDLTGAIDRWVIQTAFGRYRGGPGTLGAGIHLNVSANSVGNPTFIDFVKTQWFEFAVPPSQVCFELGETTTIHHLAPGHRVHAGNERPWLSACPGSIRSGIIVLPYLKTCRSII